jgi:hypothetical protein
MIPTPRHKSQHVVSTSGLIDNCPPIKTPAVQHQIPAHQTPVSQPLLSGTRMCVCVLFPFLGFKLKTCVMKIPEIDLTRGETCRGGLRHPESSAAGFLSVKWCNSILLV